MNEFDWSSALLAAFVTAVMFMGVLFTMNTSEELKHITNTGHLRKLTEQIKDIHEQREFNRQLLKQYEIAPEYIPYMLRERQEKLNNKLQTLWMIRKEFEK